jgi:LmbE family N-acetylglucosaminyl deacetylase
MPEKEYLPKIAMSIHAHPDDQDFTVAGTLAKWARAGCEIITVIITDGSAGTNDPGHGPADWQALARTRAEEQRAANAILGVKETIFLGYQDGELQASLGLRKDLTRLIRRYKPDTVVIGDPTGYYYGNGYINHPDHRAAAEAALYAVFPSAGSRPIFADLLEEGFEPHDVSRLYIHGSEKPDTWVDIEETLEAKIEALKKHFSQAETHDPDKWMQQWAEEEAKDQDMRYAEAYRVMILEEQESEGSENGE